MSFKSKLASLHEKLIHVEMDVERDSSASPERPFPRRGGRVCSGKATCHCSIWCAASTI